MQVMVYVDRLPDNACFSIGIVCRIQKFQPVIVKQIDFDGHRTCNRSELMILIVYRYDVNNDLVTISRVCELIITDFQSLTLDRPVPYSQLVIILYMSVKLENSI